MTLSEITTTIFSGLVMLSQLTLLVVLGMYLWSDQREKIGAFAVKYAVPVTFFVALTATFGSLFYSDVLGYTPCKLCWFQRICMYPQVVLLAIAWWKKDSGVGKYSLSLSVIGIVLAVYHYYLQLGGDPLVPCSTVGYSVSCSQRFILEYGYITIPMMALTAFALIISVWGVRMHQQKISKK
jgi:disulfide bond formation protein DsbB